MRFVSSKLQGIENRSFDAKYKVVIYVKKGSNAAYIEHPEGLAKGKAFSSRLGYSVDNWQELQKEIIQRASFYPAHYLDNNGYGDRYEQKIVLYGSKEKPANVIVGWFCKSDGSTSLSSAYIKEVE